MSSRDVLRLQGSFNITSGLWPLVHMRSFEAITGAKKDKWLVRTVSGLLITLGTEHLRHARDPHGLAVAKRLGIGKHHRAAGISEVRLRRGTCHRSHGVQRLDMSESSGRFLVLGVTSDDVPPFEPGAGPSGDAAVAKRRRQNARSEREPMMATSHFNQFLTEATIADFDTDCPLSADCLYGLYISWCIIHGLEAKPDATFRAAMHRLGVDVHHSRLRMVGPAATDYILSSYPAAA